MTAVAGSPSASAPDAVRAAVQDVLKRTPPRPPPSPSPSPSSATSVPPPDDPRAIADRARLTAAVVLDVLAGNRSPSDAASALGLSVARYYVIESQAIDGLIAGCGPRHRGRQPDPGKELARLAAENRRLTQALLRQQALVRTGQRSLGVRLPAAKPPLAASAVSPGRGKGKRQPQVRALRAVKRLNATPGVVTTPAASTAPATPASTAGDRGGG